MDTSGRSRNSAAIYIEIDPIVAEARHSGGPLATKSFVENSYRSSMPTALPYRKPVQTTEPEIFIIESLHIEDELRGRYEGRALRDALRLTGQHPAYHYCRNAGELTQAVELFRHSGYRFLHFSMHGDVSGVATTLEHISNQEFSSILSGKLKNRRVFFSACQVGSGGLSLLLQSNNQGMYSVASPLDRIPFGTACAFWMAFYTRVMSENPLGMEAATLTPALKQLCAFFQVRLEWCYFNPHPKARKWESTQIG